MLLRAAARNRGSLLLLREKERVLRPHPRLENICGYRGVCTWYWVSADCFGIFRIFRRRFEEGRSVKVVASGYRCRLEGESSYNVVRAGK